MHKRNSIVNVPLLACIVVSVAIHVAALYCKGIYSSPIPSLEEGRTVVHLTLVPSLSSRAAAPAPASTPAEPLEQSIEPQEEYDSRPTLLSVPDADPRPEPLHQPQTAADAASVDSPDLDASLVEEKGVAAEAQPLKTVQPTYPRLSRRRGEEGTVTLSIEVLQNGSAGSISILESSTHRRLDEAALKAAQKTSYTPARQFGRDIDSTIELSFTFKLTDD